MALQLAPDARWWHRLWSVRLAALGAAVSVALAVSPGLLSFVNPLERPRLYGVISGTFFLATLVARLIDQRDVPSG